MSHFQPDNLEPRIVLGLDYGTTNTALAWAQITGDVTPSPDDVKIFRNWPGQDAKIVPSAISYSTSTTTRRCKQWGWSIDDNSGVLRWTKLEFEHRTKLKELEVFQELIKGLDLVKTLQNSATTGEAEIPKQISKNAEDVVRDYLNKIARQWFQYMRSEGRFTLEQVHLDIILTHPASWSYEAINKTHRAVVGAFPKKMFPTLRGISFTSEPEASSLYTVQDMLKKDHNTLIPGECFVLCDAGGGTVDLVSYRIESIEPLGLTQIGSISGSKCGATFIDREFVAWLQPRLENLDIMPQDVSTGGHLVLTPKGRVLLERFERVKHAFNGTGDSQLTLPRGNVVNQDYQDSIVNGVMTLTEGDLKHFFAFSVNGTVDLISRKIIEVENSPSGGLTPHQVTNIFLGGGFAESEYLFKKINEYADRTGFITVQRADDCWIGVAKGAVLKGMGIGTTVVQNVKLCPRHYGICSTTQYEEWKHDGMTTNKDKFNGGMMVRDAMSWLIKQGDVILPDQPIRKHLKVLIKFTKPQVDQGSNFRIAFAATKTVNPPSNFAQLSDAENEIVLLDVSSADIEKQAFRKGTKAGGGSYLHVEIQVEIRVSSKVDFRIWHENKMLASHKTHL